MFSIAFWIVQRQNHRSYLDFCVFTYHFTDTIICCRPKLSAEQINLIEPEFPFSVDADDHCESPEEAYRDILPLLLRLGPQRSNKSKSNSTLDGNTQLRIYDPYYCNGAVVQNFTNLGLPHVYNKKENCYEIWRTENKVRYPSFDVLITNPPYSGNHIEKLIDHLTSSSSLFAVTSEQSRAWFLLLPNWVHKKDYYERAMTSRNIRPFYLVPRKRYVYLPPKDFRSAKKSDVHKKSSPFVSMWYIWGGDAERTEQLVRAFYAAFSGREPTCDLARSKSALRDLRRKPRK